MGNLINRITSDPNICNGKPIIRGMRVTVATILEYLSAGESQENILKAYPSLEYEDIKACLSFAKQVVDRSILSYEIKAS